MSSDDPLDPDQLRALAREFAASFRYQKAAATLRKIQPRTVEDDVLHANCLRHSHSPRDAAAVLEPHLDATQPHPGVLAEAAMLELEHPTRAEQLFRRALAVDAEHIDAVHGLAWLLEAQTRRRPKSPLRVEARSLLECALELAPDDPQILQTQAVALLHDGDPEAALPLFIRVADQRSRPPASQTAYAFEAHGNLACVLVALGRLDDALEAVAAAAVAGPEWRYSINRQQLCRDPDLAALHGNLRFVMSTETSPERHSDAERLVLAKEILARRAFPPLGPRPVEAFVRALRSDQPARQLEALEAMTEMSWIREGDLDNLSSDQEDLITNDGPATDRVLAEPELLRVLIDTGDVRLREVLAEFLGVLLGSFHHPNVVEIARPLAAEALERWLGDEVESISRLLFALADEAAGRLPEIADRLARTLDEQSLTKHEFVAVVSALGAQGQRRHAPLLRRFTAVEDDESRAAVVAALCRVGDPLPDRSRWLADSAWEVRLAVLEERGDELVAHDRDAVLDEWRKRDRTEWTAWCTLGKTPFEPSFVAEALALTEDEDYAMWAWGWLRGQVLTRDQIAGLLAAPFAVHPQAVPEKLAALLRSQLETSRGLPEVATSHIAPDHVDALEPYGTWRPIGGAIEAAGYLDWTSWRPWALAKLATADDRVMVKIAGALAGIGSPEDRPLLRRLFEIGSVYVKSRAAFSLLLLGEEPTEELLGDHLRCDLHSFWALRRLEGRIPESLLERVWDRFGAWERWTGSDAAEARRLLPLTRSRIRP